MSGSPRPLLSVAELLAERDERLRREKEAAAKLQQQEREQEKQFYERLQKFRVTDAFEQTLLTKIKRAFEHGEGEIMVTTFPSRFCTDEGRAVDNAGELPINKPKVDPTTRPVPDWLATMPAGVQSLYEFWDKSLRPGGFHLEARIINYPDGKPGDLGIFFTWPKAELEKTG